VKSRVDAALAEARRRGEREVWHARGMPFEILLRHG
jgi:hypothetical protein